MIDKNNNGIVSARSRPGLNPKPYILVINETNCEIARAGPRPTSCTLHHETASPRIENEEFVSNLPVDPIPEVTTLLQIEYEEMIMYFSMAGMGGKKISAREQAAEEVMILSTTRSQACVLWLDSPGFV